MVETAEQLTRALGQIPALLGKYGTHGNCRRDRPVD